MQRVGDSQVSLLGFVRHVAKIGFPLPVRRLVYAPESPPVKAFLDFAPIPPGPKSASISSILVCNFFFLLFFLCVVEM